VKTALAVLCVLLAVGPATAALRKAPVPAGLVATESTAEDIVDLALAGNRREVVARAGELVAGARGEAAELRRAGVPSATVAALQKRAGRVAQAGRAGPMIAAALAANAVSGMMPDLYAHFAGHVPPRVYTLDYLDREAQLRSLARQAKLVAAAVGALTMTWARLQPAVIAAGGARQAAAYRAHVAALRRLAPSAAAVRSEAVRGLALVDELEQVFAR
jgi:hypothetical protein